VGTIDPNQIVTLVGSIGFPGVVAWYLLTMAGKFLEKLTEAMVKQVDAMEHLAEAQQDLKTAIMLMQASCNAKQEAKSA